MRIPVKTFQISAQVIQAPKAAKNLLFRAGVCDHGTAQTAQFRVMIIFPGASQHRKNVPFVHEFWWGTYDLGAISPRKTQISEVVAVFFVLAVRSLTSLARLQHAFFEAVLQ